MFSGLSVCLSASTLSVLGERISYNKLPAQNWDQDCSVLLWSFRIRLNTIRFKILPRELKITLNISNAGVELFYFAKSHHFCSLGFSPSPENRWRFQRGKTTYTQDGGKKTFLLMSGSVPTEVLHTLKFNGWNALKMWLFFLIIKGTIRKYVLSWAGGNKRGQWNYTQLSGGQLKIFHVAGMGGPRSTCIYKLSCLHQAVQTQKSFMLLNILTIAYFENRVCCLSGWHFMGIYG